MTDAPTFHATHEKVADFPIAGLQDARARVFRATRDDDDATIRASLTLEYRTRGWELEVRKVNVYPGATLASVDYAICGVVGLHELPSVRTELASALLEALGQCGQCAADLDRGCDGADRCPTCDDPCPGCYAGPGPSA